MRPSGTLLGMVNLLGTRSPIPDRLCLDAEPRGRVEGRLVVLGELAGRVGLDALRVALDSLDGELEELAVAPSQVSSLALLEAIAGIRRTVCDGLLADATAAGRATPESCAALLARGDYVCHRPGRSLATGEAEIASRGYCDVEDRPPIASWIAVLTPNPSSLRDDEDIAIVAWVPPADLERARAGCRACPTGALTLLADLAPEAHRQLRTLERSLPK